MDRSTGLTRFGARDYDAGVGRWTCKDPVGFGGGSLGFYEYMRGDPLAGTDASGLGADTWRGVGNVVAAPFDANQIRKDVLREAAARQFRDGDVKDAWMHAEAAHRIAEEYGPSAAFQFGVLQEWLTQWRGNSPDDTEHDFMNNWQGLSYGWDADELLRRGMLFRSPRHRIGCGVNQ
jgi:RHS repeat-associated protein